MCFVCIEKDVKVLYLVLFCFRFKEKSFLILQYSRSRFFLFYMWLNNISRSLFNVISKKKNARLLFYISLVLTSYGFVQLLFVRFEIFLIYTNNCRMKDWEKQQTWLIRFNYIVLWIIIPYRMLSNSLNKQSHKMLCFSINEKKWHST